VQRADHLALARSGTSGLIRTTKTGRTRTCVLNREQLSLVDDWLAEQRQIWQDRTDRLEQFLTKEEP
jgi:hypothetical protein